MASPTHGIVSVVVDRDGDDLVVRWEGRVDGAVAVCVGSSPDTIDHTRPAAVVAGAGEARLDGLGTGGRHYVHVGPQPTGAGADGGVPSGVVAAERLVKLEGTLNFRDLGGYIAEDGRRVRWGRLFRSDGLHGLTDADHELLAAIGLRTIYDLRWPSERERQPSRLPAGGVVVHHLAVGEDPQGDDLIEQVFAGGIEEIPMEQLAEIYDQLLDQGAGTFATLLTHLCDRDALPAVFHCSAGKDRTGLSAALLLRLLGVPEDVVLDDYELSTTYRTEHRVAALRPRFEQAGLDIERFRAYLSAPRPVLAAALARVESGYGGVEEYLRRGGMKPGTTSLLRELLLEDFA